MFAYGIIDIDEEIEELGLYGLLTEERVARYRATVFAENPRRNFTVTLTAERSATPDGALDNMHTLLREKNVVLLSPEDMPMGGDDDDAPVADSVGD